MLKGGYGSGGDVPRDAGGRKGLVEVAVELSMWVLARAPWLREAFTALGKLEAYVMPLQPPGRAP